MQRDPVTSSSITSVGYDESTNVLEVEFRSGKVYQYFLVPRAVFEAFVTADSLGGYFNRFIRRHFREVEIPME